jgi:hypothetical protein
MDNEVPLETMLISSPFFRVKNQKEKRLLCLVINRWPTILLDINQKSRKEMTPDNKFPRSKHCIAAW